MFESIIKLICIVYVMSVLTGCKVNFLKVISLGEGRIISNSDTIDCGKKCFDAVVNFEIEYGDDYSYEELFPEPNEGYRFLTWVGDECDHRENVCEVRYGIVYIGTLVGPFAERDVTQAAVFVEEDAVYTDLKYRSSSVCAIHDGGLECWGINNGIHDDVPDIPGSVLDFDLGYSHACALYEDGASKGIECWGDPKYADIEIIALDDPQSIDIVESNDGVFLCVIDNEEELCW